MKQYDAAVNFLRPIYQDPFFKEVSALKSTQPEQNEFIVKFQSLLERTIRSAFRGKFEHKWFQVAGATLGRDWSLSHFVAINTVLTKGFAHPIAKIEAGRLCREINLEDGTSFARAAHLLSEQLSKPAESQDKKPVIVNEPIKAGDLSQLPINLT